MGSRPAAEPIGHGISKVFRQQKRLIRPLLLPVGDRARGQAGAGKDVI